RSHSILSLFSNAISPTLFYPLSLHDALPISFFNPASLIQGHFKVKNDIIHAQRPLISDEHRLFLTGLLGSLGDLGGTTSRLLDRSEEHTSELQSRFDLVCRLLLEKKNNKMLR